MALGVDRVFLKTSSQMEHRSKGRWKSRIPSFVKSGHITPLTTEAGDGSRPTQGLCLDAKHSERETSARKKTVTMAPTSRYMTNRRLYTARKPLISADQQISILKNPLPTDGSESVQKNSMENYQKPSEGLMSEQSETYTPESISVSQAFAYSPSTSREELYASLSLSDLRMSSSHVEPDFSSFPSARNNERRSLSSPPLDASSFTEPLSPKLTSTQQTFSHSFTSQTRPSRKTSTRLTEHEKDYSSRLKPMSSFQANYWACAIPNSLPPSPDRGSPSWDPDQEYQALLDYTYPLRPNMGNTWGSSESRSLLQTDPLWQDSGIELDRFCSSSSLSYLDQPLIGIRNYRSDPTSGQKLSQLQNINPNELSYSKSSDGRLSSSLYSSIDQVGLSVESLDFERRQTFHYRKFGIFSTSRSVPTFIRTTRILPKQGSFCELDEEFLRLPEQLQELQDLSHQLRDITAQINQPINTCWESLDKESASGTYSTTPVEQQPLEVSDIQKEENVVEPSCVLKSPLERENLSEQLKGLGAKVQVISSEVNKGSLKEVEAIIDQLSGTSLSEFQTTGTKKTEEETKESLLQHIKAFCSNLEDLIQWLYTVVGKMEVLTPPSVDIDSVKASLADYKKFQKELQAHQPLTASVLQTGEMLLGCMNSASPFLKETLMLIERQSRVLETHSEHLFSSILSAMDCLTEPSSQEHTERTPS
ncbi:centrosomal protein of 68 kDa [Hoplias malabaricus]|uniref:centrosomal protein of 68 kDa n=1 Tax=Hoplias malabaricus TaxID=27720 RepID=UPI00346237D9